MSARATQLKAVLSHTKSATPDLDGMNADTLKQAARFWYGAAAYKFRKAECANALAEVFRDRKRVEEGVRSLNDAQREILGIFKRYGGAVSGNLLLLEVLSRGLVERPTVRAGYSYARQKGDTVSELRDRLLLLPQDGRPTYHRYYYHGYGLHYPDLALAPGVIGLVESAAPLPWNPSAKAAAPTATSRRSPAEVALDLWTTAQGLAQSGNWKVSRGGSLARSVQNRLQKRFSWPESDPLLPPNPESLYYEILRGLGAVEIDDDLGALDLEAVERPLRQPTPVQGWHWVRAWMASRLWQDGLGVVPDRDSDDNPVRIEPGHLRAARELVVWGLCRVAHGAGAWLDLETFLNDLWSVNGEDSVSFYWHVFSWNPDFKQARDKHAIKDSSARRRAFWMDDVGTWAANAIMGTLGHLGLVERGDVKAGRGSRPCFRLTALGQAVFAAPEAAATEAAAEAKFLTVQPNHEVLAYLDVADASAVWPLAQMAARVSSSGLVQTFTLTRESVYQALESGLKVDEVRRFLLGHSKTGLPANVERSLEEWGRRREALILRSGVGLAATLAGSEPPFQGAARAQPVGDGFVLLPPGVTRGRAGGLVRNHNAFARPAWRVDEDGRVEVADDVDSVTRARLVQFADPDGPVWRITAASVRRARERGITAEQALGWLREHLVGELPPVVETAVRNWSSPSGAFLGSLDMLQIAQPQAAAMILSSSRFRPFLLGHVPPNWFIVRPEKRAELERLLTELGFSLGGPSLSAPTEATPAAASPAPVRRGRPRKHPPG